MKKYFKRIIKYLFALTIISDLVGCKDLLSNPVLFCHNKSSSNVAIVYTNTSGSEENENNVIFYLQNDTIRPLDTLELIRRGKQNAWREYINLGKQKRLFIYAFKMDTLRKYNDKMSLYDLRQQGKYCDLKAYSLQQLDKQNWFITIDSCKQK